MLGLAEQLSPPPAIEDEAPVWVPDPENIPQQLAYICPADELFYGGAAGGGKSDLLLGLAGTQHRSSLILRREFPPMRALIERSREIFNRTGADRGKDSYNESLHIWRLRTGRIIEFGSLQHEKDKEDYRGRPHDGKFWDELPQFSKTQYEFVNLWNRTTVPGQRTRIVSAGNAPMTLAGRWIIERWAAWLNKKHGRPAKSGEVRWYVTVDGQDVETPNSQPIEHKDANGKVLTLTPTSRCFIKAQLKDNKYLRGTAYEARLQSTPEPMRSMLLEGLFDVEFEGNAFQVIPTRWVMEAMERWRKGPKPDRPLDVLGADIARGGDDKMVLAGKRGHWYDALIKYPGHMVQDGPIGANFILLAIAGEGQPVISVDGIGIGSSVFDSLMQRNTPKVFSQIFSEGADGRRDKTGRLEFLNLRAWAYWNLREALDPSNGHNLCLPDDDELLADLTTPLWSQMPTGKIKVESKEDIKKRLGRSTDCGDAVVLAEMIAPQSSAEDWLNAWKKKDEKR